MTKPQQLMEQKHYEFIKKQVDDGYLVVRSDKEISTIGRVTWEAAWDQAWQARGKVLLEAGVEFDEDAMFAWIEETMRTKNIIVGAPQIARWQHNLLTLHYEARIAKLEAEKDAVIEKLNAALDSVDDHIRKMRVEGLIDMKEMCRALKTISDKMPELAELEKGDKV